MKTSSTLSTRRRFVQSKLIVLSNRIERAIKTGRFGTYTKRKQAQLLHRLHRYTQQLQANLKPTLKAALLGAGLLLSATVQGQNFMEQTGTANPLDTVDVSYYSTPTFVDIDGDGDMDAFIGKRNGNIKYYQNTGSNMAPTFAEQTGTANPLGTVDVGYFSAPTFVDIDDDGDMDAFIGEYLGTIKYYQNTGSNMAPTFAEQTGTANPLNGGDVGQFSTPTFVDIDGDGDMDAFIGEGSGTIKYYQNTGSNMAPTFVAQIGTANPLNGVDVGYNSAPTFVDIDGDGDMDAFIGEELGIINYYRNGFPVNVEEVLEEAALSVFPNPVEDVLNIETKGVAGEVVIFNVLGQPVQRLHTAATDIVTMDVSNLSRGQYILRFTTEDGEVLTTALVK